MKFINALVVKLVDTKDLKSLPFWECQFESGRGHQLSMKKIIVISDKNSKSLNIKKGDEVITPSFNNIADLQAIIAVGAKPVFCDIDEQTLCIDLKKAEKLINKKEIDIVVCATSGFAGLKAAYIAAKTGKKILLQYIQIQI